MICKNCSGFNTDDNLYCTKCGKKLIDIEQSTPSNGDVESTEHLVQLLSDKQTEQGIVQQEQGDSKANVETMSECAESEASDEQSNEEVSQAVGAAELEQVNTEENQSKDKKMDSIFCSNCGCQNNAGTNFCTKCGLRLASSINESTVLQQRVPQQTLGVQQPMGVPQQPIEVYHQHPNNLHSQKPPKSKGLAITGMVMGIVSVCFCFYPPVGIALALVGLIVSAIAISNPNGRGMAIAGLVISIVGLIFLIVVLTVAIAFLDALKTNSSFVSNLFLK